MRIIELKADNWKSVLDFYRDLLAALEAPAWHSASIDAAIDSIVWGGINKVQPPYQIRVTGAHKLSPEIRKTIEILSKEIEEQRADHRRQHDKDVEVSLEISDK